MILLILGVIIMLHCYMYLYYVGFIVAAIAIIIDWILIVICTRSGLLERSTVSVRYLIWAGYGHVGFAVVMVWYRFHGQQHENRLRMKMQQRFHQHRSKWMFASDIKPTYFIGIWKWPLQRERQPRVIEAHWLPTDQISDRCITNMTIIYC